MDISTEEEYNRLRGKWLSITVIAWLIFCFSPELFRQDLSILRFFTPPISLTTWILYRAYFSKKWRYTFESGVPSLSFTAVLILMWLYAWNSYFDGRFDTDIKTKMVDECYNIQKDYSLQDSACDEIEELALKERQTKSLNDDF